MDEIWPLVWRQLGAAIDMLENAITSCPDELWGDRTRNPEYWYTVYHTLFFLDYDMSESYEAFRPPPPFNLDELDPAGILPDRVYTRAELLEYLEYGREKARARIASLTESEARRIVGSGKRTRSVAEFMLQTMRHVQHHTAQLYVIQRLVLDMAPPWVSVSKVELGVG